MTRNAGTATPKSTASAQPAPAAAAAAAAYAAKQKRSSSSTAARSRFNPFSLTSSSSKLMLDKWKTLIGCICLAIATYCGYLGYLETRVNTPFDNQKMVIRTALQDAKRFWGSYRPNTYFGMKTRDPHSLVMGLMWYTPSNLGHGGQGIRHWCEQGDQLDSYGWTHHDGQGFGVQVIQDLPFEIKTSFVKYESVDADGRLDRHKADFGGDWTARISVRNTTKAWDKTISLIWYVALDERTNGHIKYVSDEKNPEAGVYGETQGLGEFKVRFQAVKGRILHKSYLSTVAPSLARLKDTLVSHFRAFADKRGQRFIGLPGEIVSQNGLPSTNPEPNFIAIQITAEVDFTLDITYQSTSGYSLGRSTLQKPITGRPYSELLQRKVKQFEQRFDDTFELPSKGYSQAEVHMARNALANMLGGIGYFYGSSRVQSQHTQKPVPYWKAPLYTAVPSRSFFPRGFLWDEGFHGLLISAWDLDIELEIICHWFDLLNVEGWIPREQILGVEALAKVPEEFVIQRNSNANPPTFFLTLKKLLTRHRAKFNRDKRRMRTLERLYPRLQNWFNWFNTTQKGDLMGSYYWRGRNATTLRELNPKSLSSGLDDFPRASHPTDLERHLDLRCWLAMAASVMAELSSILGKDDVKYYETASYLMDNQLLNQYHLDPYTKRYADWGLHTDKVILKHPPMQQHQKHHHHQQQQPEMVRVTLEEPSYKFVSSNFGYVNLFPLLLEQLDHDSPYLAQMMNELRNPQVLWTPYGLRSLSKDSPLYLKRNTEHDPPYWRGPIWININYLACKALHHYGKIEGPNAAQARQIYSELRENLVKNIFREYQRTGYLWEQYDDVTGQGKGCNPFTGWTGLVVLLMSEKF
ncbi:uncharacterized protein GCS1 [Drosophila tropicalis]|uniref:uncharacterized protein GCS1 n=1 Tax=Drosophila tropicalis TaxID=46794 RepID=UPI0035AB7954